MLVICFVYNLGIYHLGDHGTVDTKLKLSETFSYLQSNVDESQEQLKRKRRPPRKLSFSSDDDCEVIFEVT